MNVGANLEGSRRSVELAATDPRIWATVGIHPHEAETTTDADFAAIEELARQPRVVGIGECGLDRGPHNDAPFPAQIRLLRKHIALARSTGLPIVIHNRDTYPELFEILEDERRNAGGAPYRGIMHCFSGGPAEAEKSVALGFHVSFSGVLTFKNAGKTRDAAKCVAVDRLLVETDCPYLTPEPHRGSRNEPAYVAHVATTLAQIKAISLNDLAAHTTNNARRLFALSA